MSKQLNLKWLFESLDDIELDPNELYILYCIKEKHNSKIGIFQALRSLVHKELVVLIESDPPVYLLQQYFLTKKGEAVFTALGYEKSPAKESKPDLSTKAQEYNEMFPKMKAGSGSYMRSNPKDVKDALSWFTINYKYPWDVILNATARYLDEEEMKGFKYTSTSRYFIKKMDVSRTITSKLADWCEIVQNGEEIVNRPNFSDKVV